MLSSAYKYIQNAYDSVRPIPQNKPGSNLSTRIKALKEKENSVVITWIDGAFAEFHYVWLYDNRPELITSSNQKMPRKVDIQQRNYIPIGVAKVSDGSFLQMRFTGEEKISLFSSDWLFKFCYEKRQLEQNRISLRAKEFYKAHSNRNIYMEFGYLLSDEKHTFRWLDCINNHGLCVLRNVPTVRRSILLSQITFM